MRARSRRQGVRRSLLLVSFLLFPATLYWFSPALVLESAALGIAAGSLFVFAGLFVGSLFFGRAFCGWVCPGAGVGQVVRPVVGKRYRGRGWSKYVIWVPWVLAIAGLAWSAGGYTVADPLWRTWYGLSVTDPQGLIVYLVVVGLIVSLNLVFGRRGFCHTACWMAPFMVIGTAIRNRLGLPGLRLVAQPDACVSCGSCTKECPMSLDVRAKVHEAAMDDVDCVLCGTCVDGCPKGAIRFVWTPVGRVNLTPSTAAPAAPSGPDLDVCQGGAAVDHGDGRTHAGAGGQLQGPQVLHRAVLQRRHTREEG